MGRKDRLICSQGIITQNDDDDDHWSFSDGHFYGITWNMECRDGLFSCRGTARQPIMTMDTKYQFY